MGFGVSLAAVTAPGPESVEVPFVDPFGYMNDCQGPIVCLPSEQSSSYSNGPVHECRCYPGKSRSQVLHDGDFKEWLLSDPTHLWGTLIVGAVALGLLGISAIMIRRLRPLPEVYLDTLSIRPPVKPPVMVAPPKGRITGELHASRPGPVVPRRPMGDDPSERVTQQLTATRKPLQPETAEIFERRIAEFEREEVRAKRITVCEAPSGPRRIILHEPFSLSLGDKDLRQLAASGVIPRTVTNDAGRLLFFEQRDFTSLQIGRYQFQVKQGASATTTMAILRRLCRTVTYTADNPEAAALHRVQIVLARKFGIPADLWNIPFLSFGEGKGFGLTQQERELIYRLTNDSGLHPDLSYVPGNGPRLSNERFEEIRGALWKSVVDGETSPLNVEETINMLVDLFLKTHV